MGSQRVGHDLVTFRLTGWKNTKLNVILFKKKKKQTILLVLKTNKTSSKVNLRNQPYSKTFNGSLFLDINLNFWMSFNIFNNLVSFFLFKLKYVLKYWPKWLNVLILINRNSFFLCFFSHTKRANFFPACVKLGSMSTMRFESTTILSSHRNAWIFAHTTSLLDYCSSCPCTHAAVLIPRCCITCMHILLSSTVLTAETVS